VWRGKGLGGAALGYGKDNACLRKIMGLGKATGIYKGTISAQHALRIPPTEIIALTKTSNRQA
jgi:hypothetical protein